MMDRIFLAVVSGLLLLAAAASLVVLSKEVDIDPMREAPPLLRVPTNPRIAVEDTAVLRR